MELNIDFDALTVGEIDFIEDTLNEKLRSVLGDRIVTFKDVVSQFGEDAKPTFPIPQGKILRVMGWLQLRKSDPKATWEQAGELEFKAAPKEELPPPSGDLQN
jgi:hypothetical protein